MKQCSKCKRILQVSEFQKNRSNHDGFQSWCKMCAKIAAKAYRQTVNGREVCARANRKYAKTENGKEAQRRGISKYYQTEKGKKAYCVAASNQRLKYPEKEKAHRAVNNAIVAGNLHRPTNFKCECGQQGKEYHHPDYARPLYVVPLCRNCHRGIHRLKEAV